MPKTLKQILSGFMIFGDLALLLFFLLDLMNGYDVGLDLFMLAFLTVDTLLSVDYIIGLNKKEKLEDKIEETEYRLYDAQERNRDHEIADSLRRHREEQARQEELRRQEEQRREEDRRMQEDIQKKQEAQEELPDPEELQSLLQADYQKENKTGTY